MPVVGIDLGTTNSLVAVMRDGRPEVISDAHGRRLVPSVISIGEPYRLEGGSGTVKDVMSEAQARLTGVADEVRQAALHESLDPYVRLYAGRTSMEKRYDKVRGR